MSRLRPMALASSACGSAMKSMVPSAPVCFGPGLDHVVIVGRAADDAGDAGGLELAGVGEEARQMIDVAGRREGAGHGEEHDVTGAEDCVRGRVGRSVLGHELHGDRGNPLAGLDHCLVPDGWLECGAAENTSLPIQSRRPATCREISYGPMAVMNVMRIGCPPSPAPLTLPSNGRKTDRPSGLFCGVPKRIAGSPVSAMSEAGSTDGVGEGDGEPGRGGIERDAGDGVAGLLPVDRNLGHRLGEADALPRVGLGEVEGQREAGHGGDADVGADAERGAERRRPARRLRPSSSIGSTVGP